MKYILLILSIIALVGCSGEKVIEEDPDPHTFPMPMEYRDQGNKTKLDYCGASCLNHCKTNEYAYFDHGFNGHTCFCRCNAR